MPLLKYWLGGADEAEAQKQYFAANASIDEDGFLQVEEADDLCSACGKESDKLHVCAQCRAVQYCCKDCQRKHWAEMKDDKDNHYKHCALLARVNGAIEADEDPVQSKQFTEDELQELNLDEVSLQQDQVSDVPEAEDEKRIQVWIWDPFSRQWYWRRRRRRRAPIFWTYWGWRPWWWRPWIFVGRGRRRRRVLRRRPRRRRRR